MKTKSKAEELARAFVKKHVVYADNDKRLNMFFERYEQEPEFYPIAETCDGCDKDTIAVYQSFLAGMKAMSELVKAWASECAEYADDARERQIGEKLKRFIDKTMGEDGND